MKRAVFALVTVGLLSGCSVLKLGKKDATTPTVGERIAVLSSEADIAVDPALAAVPVTVPTPTVNADWAQSGGNASKSVGHVALGDALSPAWTVSIGAGSSNSGRLAAPPVVANGKVFTIDTQATVRAFSASNGAQLWQTQIRGEGAGQGVLYGGGVTFDNGRVYATNGAGDAAALDAENGSIVWLVRHGGPLRGSPTVANDNVYVISQDNQLYALNPADGSVRWQEAGALEQAAVFGVAAPAAAQGTVVAGYSSGELSAYRYENGRQIWQDALTRTSISTLAGALSDIDADPVIDNGRVFALGQGGRMVAVELTTGQRAWELNIAGISTPWVAGDWVYAVTDQDQLLAISRANGRIKWISQLASYRDPEDRQGPIRWTGPILAGNRLIVVSTTGQIASVSPYDGSVQSTLNAEGSISLSPIVANNTLYTLTDAGRLTAWR